MTDQAPATVRKIIIPPTPNSCGNCKFGVRIELGVVECHGLPPTPVVMGQGPGGIATGLLRARLPGNEPGCALWTSKMPVTASEWPPAEGVA